MEYRRTNWNENQTPEYLNSKRDYFHWVLLIHVRHRKDSQHENRHGDATTVLAAELGGSGTGFRTVDPPKKLLDLKEQIEKGLYGGDVRLEIAQDFGAPVCWY